MINDFKSEQIIIAGPCTFGNYDELYKIATILKEKGITYFRAGTFKMRTNPESFQGLREEGMEMLLRLKKELGLKIVTELTTIEQIEKYGNQIDIIQIGTRNMFNYELLKAAGKTKKPVLLKRGMCASYREWLLAAKYITNEGNPNVILCERGIRNNISTETRNVLDIQAIPYMKKNSKFPIIIDPSHASGQSYMVEPMSKAALVAGADGLIIETHYNPKESLCDAEQTIDIPTLERIISFKNALKEQ
jgi:3-deoxy-7-phosphoheptulonate synthase